MPWDGSRIMCVAPDCDAGRAVCRRRRRRRGRPAPVLAHRRHARVRVGSRRVDERVARRPVTAARRVPLARRPARARRPVVGSRASGRSRGRPTAPPSCSTATRTASAAWCVVDLADRSAGRRLAGWHPGLDWGRGRRGVHPLGRAAPRPSSPSSTRATGARTARARGAPAELDAVDLPEPDPGDVVGRRRRDRARAAVASARRRRRRRAARATARCSHRCWSTCTAVPPTRATVDWKPRVRYFVSRGWAVLHPNYRGSTGYGAATGTRSTTNGATSTSPTPSPASAPPGPRAGPTRRASR